MTFTKERLTELSRRENVGAILGEEIAELARIALASLEAEPAIHRWRRVTSEPYGPYPWHYGDFIGFSKPVDGIEDEYFYSAPPAPAPAPANAEPVAWLWSHRKHPSEVSLIRPEDDERAEGAHWSGWSCQALYAAQPASAAMKEHQIRELVNELRDIAVEYHGTQQLRERIARTIRAAMLQGAEPVSQPCTLPDGYCVMPLKLTSENGAKGALSGEFHVTNRIVCQSCAGEGCEDCNDEGGWDAEIPVSWDTIKRIHEAAVEACSLPAAPQQEVKP
ncbi:hypothetical protein [Enterobacter roggenkampii]|uniref:hypothetical protein n=1 Tax=Enterobacter roggenkampii TaxID=1812935 RepID=UPI002032D92B|nr:hypothetical protein [Enterobacter roggenkampii]